MTAQVGIIMGSKSDLPVMKEAAEFLNELEIPFEITVVSAHSKRKRVKTISERFQMERVELRTE
mgnify:CR=1 FL=1